MPGSYRWNSLNVRYPENWTLEEDEDSGSLTIHSPSGAFLSLSQPTDIQSALDTARHSMEGEYDEVETENVSRIVGQALLEGVTQRFFYLDLIIVCHLLKLECEEPDFRPLLVQIQGEDRDLERQLNVFDAILIGLTQDACPSPSNQ
ncbi:MAG: hypothetical protein KF752_15930 [Pirellulaceae bacterium]|nr:hypothetical protein [Pirellulaceae bacterium]